MQSQEAQFDDVEAIQTEAIEVEAASSFLPPAPSGWSDQLTGTDGPRFWDRIVSSERARGTRYHRPATVVLVEIAGLDSFGRAWGSEVAERLFIQLARTLSVESRSSDHIARIERTRFGILLTETDEIAAINFVERVRAACESHLRAESTVRLAFGWAGSSESTDLRAAIDVATGRLDHELDRASQDE